MTRDSITDEIRSIRHTLAAQCDNNVLTILADVRQREASDGRCYVTLPRRRSQQVLAEQGGQPERPTGRTVNTT